MDGEILPLGLVRERAQQAADEGRDHHASPWPIGTAAGQLFVREFHAARAKAAASKRVPECTRAQHCAVLCDGVTSSHACSVG